MRVRIERSRDGRRYRAFDVLSKASCRYVSVSFWVSAWKKGSDALLMQSASPNADQPRFEQIELGPTEH
ncbi:hypothetical protein, partial [Methylorubrum rhodesianum]|uniref:hypothetical protein n=1 Tax=Methylorubrum rhodesianum TaxID=29427 RepID=UPI001AEEE2E0